MYDEGTTDTTITGRAILGENADTLRPIKVDAAGELQVDVLSGGGGATHTDDAAFTPAIDDGAPAFACADETTPDSVDEGDAGCVRMSLNRNLCTVLRDAAGNERGANVDASNRLLTFSDVNSFPDNEPFNLNQWGGTGTTLGQKTMAASVPVVVASDQSSLAVAVDETSFGADELPAAAALADNTANPTTTLIGSLLHAFDGTTWDRVTNGGGTEATALRVTVANDSTGLLSVDDNGGALTVDWAGTAQPIGAGTEAAALRVTLATDSTGLVSVDDNAGSLTVDNAQLSVVGTGTEATAMRVTIASDSTGVLSVDDNAGSLTVDGTVTATVAVKALLWQAAQTSRGTVLTTELNALANAACSGVGTEIDNSTNLDQYGCVDIVLATLDPAAGGYLQLFIIQAVGGTTYEDPPTTTTNPGTHMLVATLNLLDTSSAKRVQSAWFRLPPSKIKFVLYNGAGVALNATGNTVTLYTGNDEVQ